MKDYKKLITPEIKEGLERAVDFLKRDLKGEPNLQLKYFYLDMHVIFSMTVLSDGEINIIISIRDNGTNVMLAYSDLSGTVDEAINTLKEK